MKYEKCNKCDERGHIPTGKYSNRSCPDCKFHLNPPSQELLNRWYANKSSKDIAYEELELN